MTWKYSEVFDQSRQNISLHINNCFKEKELHGVSFESVSKLIFWISNSAKNPCQQFKKWILRFAQNDKKWVLEKSLLEPKAKKYIIAKVDKWGDRGKNYE